MPLTSLARKWLRSGLITSVKTSEPRDCLQAERSLLLYCKLSGVLCLISLAMMLDFNLVNTTVAGHMSHFSSKKFARAVGIIFFILSFGALLLGLFNYFSNVYHFIGERRFSGPHMPTNYFVSLVAVCLLTVNIVLLVDSNHW